MKTLQSNSLFAVELKRKDGSTFLACGSHAAPSLFFKRKEAVKYKKELAVHLEAKGRVIPVHLEITSA